MKKSLKMNLVTKALLRTTALLLMVAALSPLGHAQTRPPISIINHSNTEFMFEAKAYNAADPVRLYSCQNVALERGGQARIEPVTANFPHQLIDNHCGNYAKLQIVVRWLETLSRPEKGTFHMVDIVYDVPWGATIIIKSTKELDCIGC